MDWKSWAAIGAIVALLGSTGYLAFAYTGKSSDLTEANSTIDNYVVRVAGLEQDTASLTDDLSAMTGERDTLEDEKADLEIELDDANSEISSLQSSLSVKTSELNSEEARTTALQGELNTVMYPRHFNSLQELQGWLQEDKTDTEYYSYAAERCYVLYVRALQDGYILPVYVTDESGVDLWGNFAVIGDTVWLVAPSDDDTWEFCESDWFDVLPSYPIPQGQ